jgi:chromosome segregation ATPase
LIEGLDLLVKPAEWAPDNTVAIVVAGIALAGSAATGLIAGRASVRANKITAQSAERVAEQQAEAERNRVEAEAFKRAKEIYNDAINELREELDRIRTAYERTQEQLDKLNDKLLLERTSSQEVREQLHSAQREMAQMRLRIEDLERTIGRLRQQIITAGLDPEEPTLNGGGGRGA